MNESPTPWVDANEIKRTVSVEQVLAHYGVLEKLKRRGNTLSGLSPFREEKNPSFFVNIAKNNWNDMGGRPVVDGAEVPGNVIGLTMALANCSFREALLKLHELAGLPPAPHTTGPRVAATAASTHANVERVLADGEVKNDPFLKTLSGLRYDVPFLKDRGISAEIAKKYGIGYCSRGLHKGRIVAPIRNRANELVAYIGRSLKHDDPEGKWRVPNGYHRVEVFGAERLANDEETRAAVRDGGIVVVEGVFDAIHLIENGFRNVVSTLGSEVSQQQCELLIGDLNPTKRVVIFFDEDDAGRAGRKRLAAQLIHRAFVRYADYSRVNLGERTDPDQMTVDEIRAALSGTSQLIHSHSETTS
jgi:DNA primase